MKDMKHTFATMLLTALLCAIAAPGMAQGEQPYVSYGNTDGGTVKFYGADPTSNPAPEEISQAEPGTTVYLVPVPDDFHTTEGLQLKAVKTADSNVAEIPRRGVGYAQDIEIVTDVAGILYHFTMPVDGADVRVSATFGKRTMKVSYLDPTKPADQQECEVEAYILDKPVSELIGSGEEGTWYVCTEDVAYTSQINLLGDVRLILADGCQMSATTISGSASQLTIYAQTGQTGQMVATAYECGVAFGQRFVVYNAATGTAASAIVSGSNSDANATFTLDGIAGKTLKPLDGNYVSINAADFDFTGTTSTTSPFTITTGSGENETTTHYYIYKSNDPATLSYTGNDFVQVTGLPEGTTLAAVTNEPMQRTFTMPATDVELTATAVTGLTATSVAYDGTARTPEIKQGDEVFAAANYAIAYQLGEEAVSEAKNVNTYTCTLTGLGQYVGTTTVPFAITKRTTSIAVEIVDPVTTIDGHPVLIAGDDAHVKVTLVPVAGEGETNLPKINGIVKIFVGSKDYTVAIVNGVGHFYVTNLAQDAYAITASYDGDANHAASTTENATTLEVCKILTETTCIYDKTPVNESGKLMINVGETITFTINVNEVGLERPVIDSETGKNKAYLFSSSRPLSIDAVVLAGAKTLYDIEQDSSTGFYYTGIVNGRGVRTFSHLPAGPRFLGAVFAGDDRYTKSSSIRTNLQVNKTETTVGVEVTSPVIAK